MFSVLAAMLGVAAGAGVSWLLLRRRLAARFNRRLAQRSEFVGAVAHQLRTPLNQVLGMAQSLTVYSEQFQPEHRALVDTLSESGSSLKSALLDVLDMLDLTANELKLDVDAAYLPKTIDFVEDTSAADARNNNTNVHFDVKSRAHKWLRYDDVRVRQCVAAAVRQCIRQTPDGNVEVTVDIKKHPKRKSELFVEITVADDCGGMDQRMAECYFSPTKYKINRFMKDAESNVLSLSLAKMLARKMGGNLTVKSAYSNGVAFTLRFPALLAKDAEQYEYDRAASTKENAADAVRDICVLIVEDNEVNIKILDLFLKGIAPKRILVARNGQEALNILATEECGLVLMDIQMPVMDGVTATRKIRERGGQWKDLPILAVTAAARGAEREACAEAGATGFLAKPVIADELYEKVVRVMRR